ncbi:MAG: M28 family peptidase [Firmicutes bacterium]|nr:M28 family peptidase [Bacillota bacterium]
MKKKLMLLLLMLAMAFAFAACGNDDADSSEAEGTDTEVSKEEIYPAGFQAFMDNLDLDFATEVDQFISEQGDDPVYGFRGAGSPAEQAVVDHMEQTMKDIGLQNVTVEETNVDGWTYKGANVTFTNADGEEQTVDLGGYQTTCKADNEKVGLIWLDRGTAADYEGVDATGKLVLIDINQNEDWWIDKPALQAKVKGAKAVIAMSELPTEDKEGNRVGTQDICGPADAPAFGISANDRDALKAAIEASGEKEIEVTFNADSEVTMDTTSHCVWGEIPGKTDEVVYMFAHMDGYFHSYWDDASGDGLLMAVAKAMIDSEYQPTKTIRFVCNGAEEFGRSDSECDWAIGAFELVNKNHPEWAENAFAVVNIDGAYCVEGETTFGIAVPEELRGWAKKVADPLIATTDYKYRYLTPQSTYKEDFNFTAQGVPSVGTAKGEETVFYDFGYHTSYDAKEATGFDADAWKWMHELYGMYVYALDQTPARPLNFAARLKALKKSYDENLVQDEELMATIDELIAAAKPLNQKIKQINADYAAAVAAEDTEAADALLAEAAELNKKTRELYKAEQDVLLWLDGELSIVFPHETRQDNINNLQAGIDALAEGNAQEALDEYLWAVGNGWYAMYFDDETLTIDENRYEEGLKDTWAEGRTDVDTIEIDDTIRTIMEKSEAKDADYTEEIEALEALKAEQEDYLAEAIDKEKEGLSGLIDMFKTLE